MKLDDFYSNVVINLKIPKFDSFCPLSEDIDGFFKANVKYRKQPRVVTVTVSEFTKEWFSFNTITVEELFE